MKSVAFDIHEPWEVMCLRCDRMFRSWFALQCHLAYFEDRPGLFHEALPPHSPRGRPRLYDDADHRQDRDKKRRRYHRRKVAA